MRARTIFVVLVTVALLVMIATPAFAVKPNGPAAYNGLNKGNSNVHHLELYEKDSEWAPVVGGAFGRMSFNTVKGTFTANGHELEPNTEYALIRYMDTWPNAYVLARATSDDYGNIHLAGDWGTWADKFWIVLGSNVSGEAGDTTVDTMTGWNPAEYLFEYAELYY